MSKTRLAVVLGFFSAADRSFQDSCHEAVPLTVGTRRKLAMHGPEKFYSLAQCIPSPMSLRGFSPLRTPIDLTL